MLWKLGKSKCLPKLGNNSHLDKPSASAASALRDQHRPTTPQVDVLKRISAVRMEDCVFGQYQKSSDGKGQSYAEDPDRGTAAPADRLGENSNEWSRGREMMRGRLSDTRLASGGALDRS